MPLCLSKLRAISLQEPSLRSKLNPGYKQVKQCIESVRQTAEVEQCWSAGRPGRRGPEEGCGWGVQIQLCLVALSRRTSLCGRERFFPLSLLLLLGLQQEPKWLLQQLRNHACCSLISSKIAALRHPFPGTESFDSRSSKPAGPNTHGFFLPLSPPIIQLSREPASRPFRTTAGHSVRHCNKHGLLQDLRFPAIVDQVRSLCLLYWCSTGFCEHSQR